MKSTPFIIVALFLQFSVFSKAQEGFVYPEDMLPALGECRDCLLANPDSCTADLKALIIEADKRKLYHIAAKMILIKGISYAYSNQISSAITYFLKAEEIAEKLPANDILVDARNNIGNMYITQGDSVRAIKYFEKSLEAAKKFESKSLELTTLTQILSLSIDQPNSPKTIALIQEIEDQDSSMNENIRAYYYQIRSSIFLELNEFDSSLIYAQWSYDAYSNHDDEIGKVSSSNNVGESYIGLNQPAKAITWCAAGLKIAEENELSLWKSQNCQCLWKAYKAVGDAKNALLYHEKMTDYEEEVKNDESIRETTALELESEFEKIQLADSLQLVQENIVLAKEKEIALNKEQKKIQFLIIGLVALFVILFLLIRQGQSRKRVNKFITAQRDMLELRQTEILDSILYAQRLQNAILPSPALLNSVCQESFVFFKPKDVVSGDFYWMNEKEFEGRKISFIAVGDCTGHGVPGAMVSVVCSNALNNAVAELNEVNTGKLLDKVNEIVQQTFKTEENQIYDGMDISLVAVDSTQSKLYFSGANNSLFIAEKLGNQSEILELKGTRQPIGRYSHGKPFEMEAIDIKKEMLIYLSSDGYQDQFGGNDGREPSKSGKKFKKKSMKELFSAASLQEMSEQLLTFEKAHIAWKGDFEQTDDICVMGIQF